MNYQLSPFPRKASSFRSANSLPLDVATPTFPGTITFELSSASKGVRHMKV